MSLIQIPKIEYITLEQFIPNWTEMIEEMDEKNIEGGRTHYANEKGLDYESLQHCLVGEAHHSNNDYAYSSRSDKTCDQCSVYCSIPASDALVHGNETFQNFKLELFTHMLEAHPQLMIK